MTSVLTSARSLVCAPLVHQGKVRELYDLGEQLLIVVTDRISAFDYVLEPAIPGKGVILNQMSLAWFELTRHIMRNHIIHTDIDQLGDVVTDQYLLRNRVMVAERAARIPIECVVRGYLTGDAWRQYAASGTVNGQPLPAGLRKNTPLPEPLFTPAKKNDIGHDENISLDELSTILGDNLAKQLMEQSIALYTFAKMYCEQRGIIIADSKFEFGHIGDEIILIDELFTPDSSRFWSEEQYALDIEIDSLDKEPVRRYLLQAGWDRNSTPHSLPSEVVEATSSRYHNIMTRLFGTSA